MYESISRACFSDESIHLACVCCVRQEGDQDTKNGPSGRQEVVVLAKVLPHDCSDYYGLFTYTHR